jgi:hypothetical protein
MYHNKIVSITTRTIVITSLLGIMPLGAQNGSFRVCWRKIALIRLVFLPNRDNEPFIILARFQKEEMIFVRMTQILLN